MEIARKYSLSLFYIGVCEAVNDPSCDSIISWGKRNNSFIIWNPAEFHKKILLKPGHINYPNFGLFLSDLKYYGFKKVKRSSEHMEFRNANFVRGKPELLKNMQNIAFRKNARKFLAREARVKKAALGLQNLRI